MTKFKKCKVCHKQFPPYNTLQKYCSPTCAYKAKLKAAKRSTRRLRGERKRKDDEWSRMVKERAGYRCEYCGTNQTLNSHHIFSRSNKATRWNLDNGVCLCVAHHTFSSRFSAHKTPTEFVEWIKEKRGKKWYDRLRKKAQAIIT